MPCAFHWPDVAVVSLYAGAGGLDLGFAWSGLDTTVAFELGAAELATHRFNFPTSHAHQLDLASTAPIHVVALVEQYVAAGSHLIVIGGPPCQSFSRCNVSHVTDDQRAAQVNNYAAIVDALATRFRVCGFLFENVPELLETRKHRPRYEAFKSHLNSSGFQTHEAVHQALDYGVPQNRRRLILTGFHAHHAKGAAERYIPPEPTCDQPVTVRDAIFGLPEPTFYRRGLFSSDIPFHPNHWTMVPRSKKFRTNQGPNLKRRSFKQLSWALPSPAVAYGHREIHVHPNGNRRLSILEAMRLQGFPDEFVLKGTLSQQVTQISNAVPVPLAASVATAFRLAIGSVILPDRRVSTLAS